MNLQELASQRAIYQQQLKDTIIALHRLEGVLLFIDEKINQINANNQEEVKE